MRKSFLATVLAAACGAPVLAAAEPTTSGVRYAAAVDLGGTRLQLNGAGTRYKGPFKVYAAGLYLTRKAATAEDVLATPGAKRIAVTMLRDIDAAELGRLFTRGVEDNMDKAAFSQLVPGLIRMGDIFGAQKKLVAGDTFTVDWLPGRGTVVSVRGEPQGQPFREPEFFDALLRIWLGPSPADWKLKEHLLGRASSAAPMQVGRAER